MTSPDSLTGLVITDGAQKISLALLTEAEAHDLVTGITSWPASWHYWNADA